ncbi:unnamed protein product [Camellia sinensis]
MRTTDEFMNDELKDARIPCKDSPELLGLLLEFSSSIPSLFDQWKEEQIMYPTSLENERFTVALANCRRQGYGHCGSLTEEHSDVTWEITRALNF